MIPQCYWRYLLSRRSPYSAFCTTISISAYGNSPEADTRDEYLSFLDRFRRAYSEFEDILQVFMNMVAMTEPRTQKHLFYLLSCLCFTDEGVELAPIKFPGVDSTDSKSRFSDVNLAAQSYLAQVPDSVAECTSDASLVKFLSSKSSALEGLWPVTRGLMFTLLGGKTFTKSSLPFLGDFPSPTYRRSGSTSSSSDESVSFS